MSLFQDVQFFFLPGLVSGCRHSQLAAIHCRQTHRSEEVLKMADLDTILSENNVVFFDMPGCPYCEAAKKALQAAGVLLLRYKAELIQYAPNLRQKIEFSKVDECNI